MSLITIILFFVYIWGFGFSLTRFVKESKDFLERNIMRLALGIALFTVLATLFTILRIPLNWWLFLLLSLILPIVHLFKKIKKKEFTFPRFKIKKSTLYFLVVLVLFAFTFYMYHKGAFIYDYYEDGDPWRHAGTVKYIALEKTALEPIPGEQIFQYLDAYPPGYDILLAMPYQISGDIIWTVKYFNALIISLGIIFFYFFAKQFTGSRKKALFSAFVLAMIPSYMSHFIWSHTLVIVLLFPFFYSLEKIEEDKKWYFVSAIVYAAIWLSQPTQAFKITILFFIYFFIKSILAKKFLKKHFLAWVYGLLTTIVVWWGWMFIKYGISKNLILAMGTSIKGPTKGATGFTLKFWGTADRVYTFNDFFIAKSQNMINNPVGVGIVLMLLLFITLIFIIIKYKALLKKENHWQIITLAWLLFAFVGIHGARLPIQLWAFRFWMLFAIFLSLIVSVGMFDLTKLLKKYGIPSLIIFLIVIAGVWFTSGKQKYAVNTAIWGPSGEFVVYGQFEAWNWIRNLPKDTKVIYPCLENKIGDIALLAYDKYTCAWCPDERQFKKEFLNKSAAEIYSFLTKKNYEYLFIDGYCAKDGMENQTNAKIKEIIDLGSFALAHQTQGSVIWKLI